MYKFLIIMLVALSLRKRVEGTSSVVYGTLSKVFRKFLAIKNVHHFLSAVDVNFEIDH